MLNAITDLQKLSEGSPAIYIRQIGPQISSGLNPQSDGLVNLRPGKNPYHRF
jgi:hypothetical protein